MASNDATVYLAFATRLRAEHRRLAELLHGLEKQWAKSEGSRDMPEMVSRMQSLRSELSRHFEEEQTGGCLDEAVSRRPSLGPEADRLLHEHGELLRRLDHFAAKLQSLSDSNEATGKFDQELRTFAQQLRAHEAAENRILEACFGAGD